MRLKVRLSALHSDLTAPAAMLLRATWQLLAAQKSTFDSVTYIPSYNVHIRRVYYLGIYPNTRPEGALNDTITKPLAQCFWQTNQKQ